MTRKAQQDKAAKLVCRIQDLRSNVDAIAQSLRDEQAALDGLIDQWIALTEGEEIVAALPLAEKRPPKAQGKARKPKAPQVPAGFEAEAVFTYTNAEGKKSLWTVHSVEDTAIMASRQGTTKQRSWKFTSLAAMLQSSNIVLGDKGRVSKPRNTRKPKAA